LNQNLNNNRATEMVNKVPQPQYTPDQQQQQQRLMAQQRDQQQQQQRLMAQQQQQYNNGSSHIKTSSMKSSTSGESLFHFSHFKMRQNQMSFASDGRKMSSDYMGGGTSGHPSGRVSQTSISSTGSAASSSSYSQQHSIQARSQPLPPQSGGAPAYPSQSSSGMGYANPPPQAYHHQMPQMPPYSRTQQPAPVMSNHQQQQYRPYPNSQAQVLALTML
jgi:hypothetical protein